MNDNLPTFEHREARINAYRQDKGLRQYDQDSLLQPQPCFQDIPTDLYTKTGTFYGHPTRDGKSEDRSNHREEPIKKSEPSPVISRRRKESRNKKASMQDVNVHSWNGMNVMMKDYDGKLKDDLVNALKELEMLKHEKMLLEQKNDMNLQRMDEMEKEKDSLSHRYARIKNKYSTKKNQIMHYKKEFDDINNKYKREVGDIGKRTIALEEERNDATEKLKSLGSENAKLKNKISIISEQNKDEQRKIHELQDKIMNDTEAFDKEKADVFEKIKYAQTKMQSDIAKLTEDKKTLINERNGLITTLSEMESKYSRGIDESLLVKQKLAEALEAVDELQEERSNFEKKYFAERNRNEVMQNNEQTIKSKLEIAVDDYNKLTTKMHKVEKDYREMVELSDTQFKEHNAKTEDIIMNFHERSKKESDEKAREINMLRSKLKMLNEEVEKISKHSDLAVRELELIKRQKNEEHAKADKKIESLKTKLQRKDTQLKEDIERLNQTIKDLLEENEKLKQESKKLMFEGKDRENDYKRAHAEHGEYKLEFEKLKKEYERLEQENQKLDNKLKDNQNKVTALTLEHLKEKEALVIQNKQLELKLQSTNSTLQDLQERNTKYSKALVLSENKNLTNILPVDVTPFNNRSPNTRSQSLNVTAFIGNTSKRLNETHTQSKIYNENQEHMMSPSFFTNVSNSPLTHGMRERPKDKENTEIERLSQRYEEIKTLYKAE